jgi:hypothetical protein
MSDNRFCKDCRWVRWPWRNIRDSSGAMCNHPSVMRPDVGSLDPVTGRRQASWPGTFCTMERQFGRCGPDDKNWEPQQPPEPVGFVDNDPPPRAGGAMEELG